MEAKKRILSLDVFRGMTIILMIIVNNPAVWGRQFPILQHAEWHGMTPTDLVFPFFVFIMGMSAMISLSRRASKDSMGVQMGQIFKRAILLFLVGVVLQIISGLFSGAINWERFRILGVLQALALCYLFGALVILGLRFRHLTLCAAILLLSWWLIQILGNGFELSKDNVINIVDRALLGESHLYREGGIRFDPESLLTTIPRIAQFLLGAAAGSFLLNNREDKDRQRLLLILGAVVLITGLAISPVCPLNKKVWTSSFALVTSGIACLAFVGLYWIIDNKKKTGWTAFFRVFGMNSLFLYCVAWVMSSLMGLPVAGCGLCPRIFSFFEPLLGAALASLVYSLIFVAIVWLVAKLMDKLKIYVKL